MSVDLGRDKDFELCVLLQWTHFEQTKWFLGIRLSTMDGIRLSTMDGIRLSTMDGIRLSTMDGGHSIYVLDSRGVEGQLSTPGACDNHTCIAYFHSFILCFTVGIHK